MDIIMHLVTVNLAERWALTTDNRVVRVKAMFDLDGDPTQDPEQAVIFTAGDGFDFAPFLAAEIPSRVIN